MQTQKLETERLILRKLKLEDENEVFNNWTSDDEVSKYVRWSTHKSIEDTREYLKNTMETYKKEQNAEWGIVLKETNELIGAMGCFFNDKEKRYEIGYNISRKQWRNGYTTEALKRVMDYLINVEHITSFICSHAKDNPASGAVMKKAGFKYVKDATYEKFDKSQKFDCRVYYFDTIKLVKPTKEHKNQLIEYKMEHFNNGEKIIHACSRWDKMDNYEEWLKLLKDCSNKETVSKDWTVSTEFLGIREKDNRIVGMISIRHELTNDFLKNYAGHIGYGVRPTERRKGYVTQMLNQALKYCKDELKLDKVMISCDKKNEGSRKTILNAGGILEKEYTKDDEEVQIYWINL